jgi:beta-mannosidase
MKKILLDKGWKLSHFDPTDAELLGRPSAGWKAAKVPGVVQTSPFGLPRRELYQGVRVREAQWMQNRLWVFRRTLEVPQAGKDQTVRMIFAGLDYRYEIRIDGALVAGGEGMFHAVTISLEANQGKRVQIEVRLMPPPQTKEEGWEATKAQFARGWDFAPELRTVGIWDDVWLEVVPRLRVENAFIETRLQNSQRALVTVHAELSETVKRGWMDISLCGVRRRVPLLGVDRVTAFVEIESPRLWWPNALGEPALHDLSLSLAVENRRTEIFVQKVGLREVGRIPAQGQRPTDIPLQFTVNGVPFFINGMNWVPPDSCVGDITPDQYDRQLEKFQAGHVNLVRVWGGGLREKAHFYEKCDQLGLLVFQEYPIACGMGASESFYRQLQAEARQIARTLRRHPSVFLFCGGNENYHYWNMLDSDEPRLKKAARLAQIAVNDGKPFNGREWLAGAVKRYDEPVHLLLGGITAEECPHCLYQNTSAMEGEGEVHGIWTWDPRIGDHRYRGFESLHAYWRAADQHLYSEASVPSIANLETVREVTGKTSNKLPDFDDGTWKLHHGFGAAWDGNRDVWLDIPSAEKVFGPIRNLGELTKLNQYLQAEGGRFMIEELRRKQPVVSGVIWWGANEPWPGLAGNALIDYHGRAKLSWPIVANAFAPVILSLRYEGLHEQPMRGELWLSCNDRCGFSGRYQVKVLDRRGRVIDFYEGACCAQYRESQPLRRLIPVRIAPKEHVAVQATLFDEADSIVHENLYLFGNIRAAVLKLFANSRGPRVGESTLASAKI